MEAAAAIWGICQRAEQLQGRCPRRLRWLPPLAADRLFEALASTPSRVVFAETTCAESWQAVARPEQRINLHIPELLPELAKLAHSAPPRSGLPVHPRRRRAAPATPSNTAVPAGWHRRGRYGTLRISPQDAEALGADGEVLRVVTRRGEVPGGSGDQRHDAAGQYLLANRGHGLPQRRGRGGAPGRGAQQVTDCTQRDFLASIRHKYVPAETAGDARRYERLSQGGRS